MNITQKVSLGFVPSCRFCVNEVEAIVGQLIREPGVTAINIQAGNRCDHESAKDLTARLTSSRSKVETISKAAPGAAVEHLAASNPPCQQPILLPIEREIEPSRGLNGFENAG